MALGTICYFFFKVAQGVRQFNDLLARLLQQVKRYPLRRFPSDGRQPRKMRNDCFECFACVSHPKEKQNGWKTRIDLTAVHNVKKNCYSPKIFPRSSPGI